MYTYIKDSNVAPEMTVRALDSCVYIHTYIYIYIYTYIDTYSYILVYI
jgi:hypothetical protein